MPVSIEIRPLCYSVDMYGVPETSTAYSLSGEVAVSVSSSSSFFDAPRPVKLILKSLSLTFEGQSELIDAETGYAAMRVCEVQRELAPQELMELSNEGHEESGKPCTWNFVFDLPIPGWLPTTSVFGSDAQGEAGTRYALYATAHFVSADDGSSRGWSLATLCSAFSPRTKVVHADPVAITVNRHILPPSGPSTSSLFPSVTYVVQARVSQPTDSSDSSRIPSDILSKAEVLASIPECISLDELTIPLTLRLRAPKLEEEHRQRLKLTEFTVDVTQFEKYRTSPTDAYTSHFPVPPISSQPPTQQLISPHQLKSLCDVGLVSPSDANQSFKDSFSVLPPSKSGRFILGGDGHIFAHDGEDPTLSEGESERTWFKMEADVPVARTAAGDDKSWEARHGRVKRLRTTEEGPLLSVCHELHVVLECAYDREAEGLEPATEHLHFVLPVQFVSVPLAPVSSPSTSTHSLASSVTYLSLPSPSPSEASPSGPAMPPAHPYASNLPAYSQLFHSNGDRKIDYSIPLPIYTPPSSPLSVEAGAQPTITPGSIHGEKALDVQDSSMVLSGDSVAS